jgi:hypothetical protein
MVDPQGPQLLMAFCSARMQHSLNVMLSRIADANPDGHGRALRQSSSTQEAACASAPPMLWKRVQ